MSEHIRRGVFGALMIGAAHFVLTGSGYVIAVVLARGLGPAQYGAYGVIYSLLVAAELAVQFGIPVAVSRLIAEQPSRDRELTHVGLALVLATYSVVFAVTWISAPQLAELFKIPDGAPLFRIAAIDLPFYGAYLFLENVLGGRRDFASKSNALFVYAMAKLVGILCLAVIGLSIQGALIVNVLASIIALGMVYAKIGHAGLGFRMDAAKYLMRIALPTALIDAGTQVLLYSDLWLADLLSTHPDPKIQGYYVAAKNLARAPMIVSLALNSVLVPSLAHATASHNRRDAERFIHGTTRFLALALIPSCALVAVNAEPIMSLIFSDEYAAGGPYLALLIIGSGLLFTVFSILLSILLAIGKQQLAAAIGLGAMVPTIIANVILIPRFGAVGAGIASIAATLSAVIVVSIALHRILGSLIDLRALVRVILCTIPICWLSVYVQTEGLQVVIELAAMGLIFAALCVPLRLVSKSDLTLIRKQA